ncbi:hypothetical protein OMVG_00209 [Ostreococcus lucimarinus virus OlV3]|nr:hypothetical protein OMVG_00209 [Ostreococcus lucimarinus virus OlV3]
MYLKKRELEYVSYKYISKSDLAKRETPCVITDATSHWSAHTNWSFETFDKARFMLADNVEPRYMSDMGNLILRERPDIYNKIFLC